MSNLAENSINPDGGASRQAFAPEAAKLPIAPDLHHELIMNFLGREVAIRMAGYKGSETVVGELENVFTQRGQLFLKLNNAAYGYNASGGYGQGPMLIPLNQVRGIMTPEQSE